MSISREHGAWSMVLGNPEGGSDPPVGGEQTDSAEGNPEGVTLL